MLIGWVRGGVNRVSACSGLFEREDKREVTGCVEYWVERVCCEYD